MDNLKSQLQSIIERHRGRQSAITAKDLSAFLGENERHVRLIEDALRMRDVRRGFRRRAEAAVAVRMI